MNRAWILGLACCLLPLPSFGQGRDTVLAVRHLFNQKRGNGASMVSSGLDMAYDESIGWRAQGTTTSEKVARTTFYGGIPLVVGILQSCRYSLEREKDIIQHYNEGRPIPADVRRKLRRKYFRRTARDIVAF